MMKIITMLSVKMTPKRYTRRDAAIEEFVSE